MADRTIARRYARAFLEVVDQDGLIDRAQQDLGKVAEAARASRGELLRVLATPVFTLDERRAVLEALLSRLDIHPTARNLLNLLLEKGRFALVSEISEVFAGMADTRANRTRVTVETAEPVSQALEREILKALERVTGKTVVLETVVKPELIGGMVARIGGRVYDASVRARLEGIRQKLIRTQIPAEA
jgi:F-type H+-transporting ATPase subunit delta